MADNCSTSEEIVENYLDRAREIHEKQANVSSGNFSQVMEIAKMLASLDRDEKLFEKFDEFNSILADAKDTLPDLLTDINNNLFKILIK